MLNSTKIENLKSLIINQIKGSEIFDENHVFTLAKNYAKENNIEISKGEIRSIINSLIILLKNQGKIKNLDNTTYYSNNIEYNYNPIKDLYNSTEFDI